MKALFSMLVVLGLSCLKAQSPAYRLFTMREGLSQMKITSLHLDVRGYLWIGTRNGLNKFDGEKFTVYTEKQGLLHNRIHGLDQDNKGNLVILTYNGLCFYDGEKFTSFPKPFNSVLFDLAVDEKNTVWICERYSHAALYAFRNGKYETILDNKSSMHFQYDRHTHDKYLTTEGKIYRLVNDSLNLMANGGFFFYPTSGDVDRKPYFVRDAINGSHRLLYYATDTTLSVVATINEQNDKPTIKDISVNHIWNSARSQLDLPSHGNGRIVFDHEFPITNDVVKDAADQYWIGSENGLGQVYNNAFTSLPVEKISNVWTLLEDKRGNLWMGTYGNGLFKMKDGKVEKASEGKAYHYFAASAVDKRNRLYFGTNLGLEIIDGLNSTMVWQGKTVFSLSYDERNDHMIFGTLEGAAIYSNDGRIRFYGIKDGLHDNHYIQSTGIDHKGRYWLGSYTGLSCLDPASGQVKNYTRENNKLPGQGVYCSFTDESGQLWLGGDLGLMWYNENKDSISLIKSMVVQGMVKAITAIDGQQLLISTKDGLYIFNTKQYLDHKRTNFIMLNQTNGYAGTDPGFNGFCKLANGPIWICSALSVDRLDPTHLKLNDQHLKVNITHFNDQPVAFDHQQKRIILERGIANVVIRFEALGFARPLHTLYQYRINNGPWSVWEEQNEAILNDLTDGNYVFEVRAGPSDDVPIYTDSIHFVVQMPFYRHSWFAPLAICLSLFLLGLSAKYFIDKRRADKLYKSQLSEAQYLRSQLLLSQLNPHFIFNVLANIQNKIIFDKKEEASKAIVNLSKMLRNFLQVSYRGNSLNAAGNESEILLSTEIELLKAYIEFEQDKCHHHFDFWLEMDDNFHPESYTLPPMLLQPFVENAIRHGLLLQEKKGNLWLKFKTHKGDLICIVEDDGVGMKKSMEMHKDQYLVHKSLGSKIVKERIQLLNQMGYQITIQSLDRLPQGTTIEMTFKE